MVEEIKIKRMYAVERFDVMDNYSTYEIFASLKDAVGFAEGLKSWDGVHIPLYIFRANFNKDRIYSEKKCWHYEDFSDTILSPTEILIEFNDPKGDSFEIKEELWEKIEKLKSKDEIKSLFTYPKNETKFRRRILKNASTN